MSTRLPHPLGHFSGVLYQSLGELRVALIPNHSVVPISDCLHSYVLLPASSLLPRITSQIDCTQIPISGSVFWGPKLRHSSSLLKPWQAAGSHTSAGSRSWFDRGHLGLHSWCPLACPLPHYIASVILQPHLCLLEPRLTCSLSRGEVIADVPAALDSGERITVSMWLN